MASFDSINSLILTFDSINSLILKPTLIHEDVVRYHVVNLSI